MTSTITNINPVKLTNVTIQAANTSSNAIEIPEGSSIVVIGGRPNHNVGFVDIFNGMAYTIAGTSYFSYGYNSDETAIVITNNHSTRAITATIIYR